MNTGLGSDSLLSSWREFEVTGSSLLQGKKFGVGEVAEQGRESGGNRQK